jgi:hypothetical protein
MDFQRKAIPLMPLAIVMTQGERRVIDVEEKAYVQLVDELRSSDRPNIFGIPFADQGVLSANGSLVKLVPSDEKKAKPSAIRVECTGHFQALSYAQALWPKPYPGGIVREIDARLERPIDDELKAIASRVIQLLGEGGFNMSRLSYANAADIMRWLGMPAAQKHQLLISRGRKRRGHLMALLQWAHTVLRQEVEIKNGFFPN